MQFIDNMQQAGKIDNLQRACGVFGCVDVNKKNTRNIQVMNQICHILGNIDTSWLVSAYDFYSRVVKDR